jgi:hypothetical protein
MWSAAPARNCTPFSPPVGVPPDAVQPNVAQYYGVVRAGIDHDAVRAVDQHGCNLTAADIDRNCLVIVTAPKPPGSRTEISPPAAVLEIAPANVLQGAVRLQGLASSPTPDTHVRGAWALAGCMPKAKDADASTIRGNLCLNIASPLDR